VNVGNESNTQIGRLKEVQKVTKTCSYFKLSQESEILHVNEYFMNDSNVDALAIGDLDSRVSLGISLY
jgi:hypothetical protein